MAYSAAIQALGSLPSYRLGVESYDADKLGLGPLMIQQANYAGPIPLTLGRPSEASTAITCSYPYSFQWSNSTTNSKDYLFLAEISAAAATRRLVAYEFNRLTAELTWKGFVTITFPSATSFTIRSFRMSYEKHTTGTVAVSGTAVTGTSTTWQTDRACVGNRIGFGSTDPSEITTWYEISAIGSDTGITLSTNAGTITAGTPYVIEDLRAVIGATNATATNGGLFVVKGLRYENFQSAGTAIPAATTVDNIRACYWLKSATTITETVNGGLGLQSATNKQTQIVWLTSGTTTLQLFKFNIRAALTLTSGADTTAFQFSTAVSATLTGTATQTNNGRIANIGHGPGAGVDCFYFTSSQRVYRSKPVSTITAGDTTWLSGGDSMTEIPPGGTTTSSITSAIQSIEYVSVIDGFIIPTGSSVSRDYFTKYKTDSSAFDRLFGCDTRQINQSTGNSSITTTISRSSNTFSAWADSGLCYLCLNGGGASGNYFIIFPIGADWDYASTTNNRLILPRISLQSANKLAQAYVSEDTLLGGNSGLNLGSTPEPYKLYYRTAGITDNSGSWTLINDDGLLTGVDGDAYVQFMFEFRTMGFTCVSPRIHSVGVIYDTDDSLPSELRWNLGDSNNTDGTVGVTQISAFASLTTLTITYYRADTQAAVLVQSSSGTTNGNWQFWNGSAWTNGLGSNAADVRRRFVPSAGLPTGVDVYAKIVVA
jgi:hypothetical protein